jgi:hypothetical protein
MRKFSISHIQSSSEGKPTELIWLLSEVSMLTSKLTELLFELNEKIELVENRPLEVSLGSQHLRAKARNLERMIESLKCIALTR